MSTLCRWIMGMRWAVGTVRYCTFDASPRMSLAMALTMSMSKPAIWPVAGSRKPHR